ncbi:hypothetical protein ACM66B_002317 [Microbotryomycetes sp. NB124-2]
MRSRWCLWVILVWLAGAALASNDASPDVAQDERVLNETSVIQATTAIDVGQTKVPDNSLSSTVTSAAGQLTGSPTTSAIDVETTTAEGTSSAASMGSTTDSQPANASMSPLHTVSESSVGLTATETAAQSSSNTLDETISWTASLDAQPAQATAEKDPIAEETQQIPPELLSFQEWKEKYAVVAVSNSAGSAKQLQHKSRKSSQDGSQGTHAHQQQQAQADPHPLDDLRNLSQLEPLTEYSLKAESAQAQTQDLDKLDIVPSSAAGVVSATNGRGLGTVDSPFQPLPDVGTGSDNDPLLHLRDRSNYALADCSAKLLRSSKQSKGASSILVEKKDRYMLTPCNVDPKFVEVELCDEIQIDTLVLANFELFSSMFKHFEVSCSVDYPGKADSWHNLGRYRARNARGVQVFATLPVPAFCRFLRINFLSHYGSEYFCPVSLIRVYGYTQLDAYRESQRREAEEARLKALLEPAEDELVEVVVPTIISTESAAATSDANTIASVSSAISVDSPNMTAAANATSSGPAKSVPTATGEDDQTPRPSPSVEGSTTSVVGSAASDLASTDPGREEKQDAQAKASSTAEVSLPVTTTTASTSSTSAEAAAPNATAPASGSPEPDAATITVTGEAPSLSTSIPAATTASNQANASPNATVAVPPLPRPVRNDTRPLPPLPPRSDPQPGESIFATIMKRLSSLEHNQTLSAHFMEAQSGMLRDVLTRLDRRLIDLEGNRQRQEQTFRQAIVDAERLRLELDRERLALAAQVSSLAREVRLERHLSIAELIGLLALFVFVGLTRGSPTSPFGHLAAMQHSRQGSLSPRFDSSRPSSPVADHQGASFSHQRSGQQPHSGSNLTRTSSLKRPPNASKPSGLRRHYGVGPSSKAHLSRASRTWTPPVRHSSAPPEDFFALNLASALDSTTRSTIRRASRKHATMPPGLTNGGGSGGGGGGIDVTDSRDELWGASRFISSLSAGDAESSSTRPGSSLSNYRAYRPHLMSRKSTTADDADTEPCEAEERLWTSDAPSESSPHSRDRRSNHASPGDDDDERRSSSDEDEEDGVDERDSSSPSPAVIVLGANPFKSKSLPALPLSDSRYEDDEQSRDAAKIPFDVDPKSPEPTPEPEQQRVSVKQEPSD